MNGPGASSSTIMKDISIKQSLICPGRRLQWPQAGEACSSLPAKVAGWVMEYVNSGPTLLPPHRLGFFRVNPCMSKFISCTQICMVAKPLCSFEPVIYSKDDVKEDHLLQGTHPVQADYI